MEAATPDVLVVEDDATQRMLYGLFLKAAGLSVEELNHQGRLVEDLIGAINASLAKVIILDGNYRGGTAEDVLRGIEGSGKKSVVVTASQAIIDAVSRGFPSTPVFLKGSPKGDMPVICNTVHDYVKGMAA